MVFDYQFCNKKNTNKLNTNSHIKKDCRSHNGLKNVAIRYVVNLDYHHH
jgi:hypothetical protein